MRVISFFIIIKSYVKVNFKERIVIITIIQISYQLAFVEKIGVAVNFLLPLIQGFPRAVIKFPMVPRSPEFQDWVPLFHYAMPITTN